MVNIWFKRTILWWKHDRIQWRTRRYAQLWHRELSWKNCNFYPLFWGIFTPKIFFVKKILWKRPRYPSQLLILILHAYIKDISMSVFNRKRFRCSIGRANLWYFPGWMPFFWCAAAKIFSQTNPITKPPGKVLPFTIVKNSSQLLHCCNVFRLQNLPLSWCRRSFQIRAH